MLKGGAVPKRLRTTALESFDGEYSDSKSDILNSVIADIQNEEDSSDLDDECTGQEASINTDDGARAQNSSDNDEKTLLSKDGSHCDPQFPPKSLQDNNSSTMLLESMQDLHHIPHLASKAAVLFLRSASFLTSTC